MSIYSHRTFKGMFSALCSIRNKFRDAISGNSLPENTGAEQSRALERHPRAAVPAARRARQPARAWLCK